MLHSPNKCTHNNVHVHRHELDPPTRQPPHTQHHWQRHVPGHGGGAGQRELGAERDRQHATAKPPCALRLAQL